MTSDIVTPAPQLAFPIKGYSPRVSGAKIVYVDSRPVRMPAPAVYGPSLSADMEQRILCIKDIRNLDQQERAVLLKGPIMEIIVTGQIFGDILFKLEVTCFTSESSIQASRQPHQL